MFHHAVILGPHIAAPWRGDDVGHVTRILLALKRAGVRTALATSVDAAAPTGALAPDELFLDGYDESSVIDILDRLQPDVLFWLPGGAHARDVVNAIEQTGYFQEAGIELVPRPERLRRLEDPDHLAQLVRPFELSVPANRIVADGAQLRGAVKTLGLPVSIRPLSQLTSTPWTPLRDDQDVARAVEQCAAARHWVVRRTPRAGLTLDVLVALDRFGTTRLVGAVRHCEPWLTECASSTVYTSPELQARSDVARLAEDACQVARVADIPGLLVVRLCANALTETCEVLDVMAAPTPATWLMDVTARVALYDVALSLWTGHPLSIALDLAQASPRDVCVVGLPRSGQTPALERAATSYVWGAGHSLRVALDAAVDSGVETLWPGAVVPRAHPAVDATQLAGAQRWLAIRHDHGAADNVAATLSAMGLECEFGPSPRECPRPPSDVPWVAWSPTAEARLALAGDSCKTLLLLAPMAADLCVDSTWSAVQATEALRARERLPLVATSSLALAALLQDLGVGVMSLPSTAEGLAAAALGLGVTRILPMGRTPPLDVVHRVQAVGIEMASGNRSLPLTTDRWRPRDAVGPDRLPLVPSVRATNVDDAIGVAEQSGWPVLASIPHQPFADVVMGTRDTLARYCRTMGVGPERPVVLFSVPVRARVLEAEALCAHGRVLVSGWSEHVEAVGSHARLSLTHTPPQRTYPEQLRRARSLVAQVARQFEVEGPLSMRLLVSDQDVRVLSIAPGSTRHWPHLSRAFGFDWAECWVSLVSGEPSALESATRETDRISLCIRRLPTLFESYEPRLAPPPASLTVLGDDPDHLLVRGLCAAGLRVPIRGVWLSAATVEDRIQLIRPARLLREAGIRIHATEASAACLRMNDVDATTMPADEDRDSPFRRRIDAVVAIAGPSGRDVEESRLARFACVSQVPLIEDLQVFQRLAEALARPAGAPSAVRSWNDDHRRVQQWA